MSYRCVSVKKYYRFYALTNLRGSTFNEQRISPQCGSAEGYPGRMNHKCHDLRAPAVIRPVIVATCLAANVNWYKDTSAYNFGKHARAKPRRYYRRGVKT